MNMLNNCIQQPELETFLIVEEDIWRSSMTYLAQKQITTEMRNSFGFNKIHGGGIAIGNGEGYQKWYPTSNRNDATLDDFIEIYPVSKSWMAQTTALGCISHPLILNSKKEILKKILMYVVHATSSQKGIWYEICGRTIHVKV
jgi:hypothetical protein